jgi:plastocyanin
MFAAASTPLRRFLSIGGLVGAAMGGVGCGERAAPPAPNSRGVWLYGVTEADSTPVRSTSSGTYVPPPAPKTAPTEAAPVAAAAPKPDSTPSTPSTSPTVSTTQPADAYKVVALKDAGSIHALCRLTGAPAELSTITAFKHKDLGCTDHKTERCRFVKKGEGDLRLGNCVVYLRAIDAGKDWPAALRGDDRSFLVDQKACVYLPHVGWTRPATQVVVANSDRAEHNIHGNFGVGSKSDTTFNFSSEPGTRKDAIKEAYLETLGEYFFKCDIHPWMNAYLHVMPHPYVAITPDEDGDGGLAGEVVLDDVPPGTYELVCWHEGMISEPMEANGVINGFRYSADILLDQAVTVAPKGRQDVVFTIPYK